MIAMRYWHPLTAAAVAAVKAFSPDRIVLLPLYPQYSTTTTGSSLNEWRKLARRARVTAPQHDVCCYPFEDGFVSALCDLLGNAVEKAKPELGYRVLFSAHGLPKRVIERGDPYQWQVERTVQAVLERWQGAPISITRSAIRAGSVRSNGSAPRPTKRSAAPAPRAKASSWCRSRSSPNIPRRWSSSTSNMGNWHAESGVPDYIRVPAVRSHPMFIEGLARLVGAALNSSRPVNCADGRICPAGRTCGYERTSPHA